MRWPARWPSWQARSPVSPPATTCRSTAALPWIERGSDASDSGGRVSAMHTIDPASPSGQVVVVGASGEVGAAIVARLRKAAVPVVAVARDRDRLEQLSAADHGITVCPADIGD